MGSKKGCRFEIDIFDGRDCEHLIDDMYVGDVWGWLLAENEEKNDDNFGCVIWEETSEGLKLEWKTDFSDINALNS